MSRPISLYNVIISRLTCRKATSCAERIRSFISPKRDSYWLGIGRFLIRVEPFRDETGKLIRWYGTSTDIEALKQTQEKLREDERELRRITDAIPQTIVVLDPTGAP